MARVNGTPPAAPPAGSRAERTLGVMAATVVGFSLLAMIAVFVAGILGVDTGTGVWAVITLLPLIGLPLGVLLLVAAMIANAVRRSHSGRSSG
jgi:hypothetical protein